MINFMQQKLSQYKVLNFSDLFYQIVIKNYLGI